VRHHLHHAPGRSHAQTALHVAKHVGLGIVVASAGVLAVAGLGWVLCPKCRPAITAAVLISPIPPVP